MKNGWILYSPTETEVTTESITILFFGSVANDTIYRTFIAYEEGILTKDETIARLKVKKLFDQMTFTTELALKELKYIGQFDAGRDHNE